MATPVRNQDPQRCSVAQEGLEPIPKAPAGVGDTPTTMESAERQQPYQLGYIETAGYFIRAWVLWAFKKIFSYWLPEVRPPGFPEPSPPIRRAKLLEDLVNEQVAILQAFDDLKDLERGRIHYLLGRETYRFYHIKSFFCSYEQIGENEKKRNPMILKKYMRFTPDQEQFPS